MNTITHTIRTFGGEMASIGGVGGFTAVDATIRVQWNDAGSTTLIVRMDRGAVKASGYHKGKSFQLPRRDGDIETVANRWIKAIEARLRGNRLQDRVRGWNADTSRLSA